jgi:hypothetical protein
MATGHTLAAPGTPTIVSVSSPDLNASYKAGDTIRIVVTFDQAVDVDTTGGRPTLRLATGQSDSLAQYTSGSASAALTFTYQVRAGDSSPDLDYDGTDALVLNGATLVANDGSGDAWLVLPDTGGAQSLAGQKALLVDGVGPTLAISKVGSTPLKVGETTTITFSFSEDPGGTFTWDGAEGDVNVTGGTLSALSGTGVSRTATFTPTPGVDAGSATITVNGSAFQDTLGNPGAGQSLLQFAYDTKAPTVTISADKASLLVGQTATIFFSFSEDPGSTFTWSGKSGDVTVTGGTVSAVTGTGTTRTATFTPDAGVNGGLATITVNALSYADAAGNAGSGGVTPLLRFDTLAPSAPVAPTVAVASDTGSIGDGRTSITRPTIEGVAEANAFVTLYDGAVEIGTTTADVSGRWSVAPTLPLGTHLISAVQRDVAGNVSVQGTTLSLVVEPPSPPVTEVPPTVVDGVAIQTGPTTLPGGFSGTFISVPTVNAGRVETGGAPGVADIPLFTNGGVTPLLAQIPTGYGLTGSGGTVPLDTVLTLLLATIKAAASEQPAADQGGLTGGGTTFLSTMPAGSSLLVMAVAPVGAGTPTGSLTLSGAGAPDSQQVALVIDGSGLGSNGSLTLSGVDFAAVIGAAKIDLSGSGSVLIGDGASQHVSVLGGTSNTVLAGGGADVLSVQRPATTVNTSSVMTLVAGDTTVLHGGQGSDIVSFAGNREDYMVTAHNGHLMVASKADPGSAIRVVNVEQLQFGNELVTVQNHESVNTLTGLYNMVLGRQADVGGMSFWADARDAGATWGTIALGFVGAAERHTAGTTFNGNAEHDVTVLFDALFHRAPDAEGLAFWSAALKNGASLAQVASGFVESVEMVGHQLAPTDWNFQM